MTLDDENEGSRNLFSISKIHANNRYLVNQVRSRHALTGPVQSTKENHSCSSCENRVIKFSISATFVGPFELVGCTIFFILASTGLLFLVFASASTGLVFLLPLTFRLLLVLGLPLTLWCHAANESLSQKPNLASVPIVLFQKPLYQLKYYVNLTSHAGTDQKEITCPSHRAVKCRVLPTSNPLHQMKTLNRTSF